MRKSIPNLIITISLAAIFVVAFVTAGISAAVKKAAAKRLSHENDAVVLRIGENEITRDEFVFFCVTTLESDFESLKTGGTILDKMNDSVKEMTVNYLEEFYAVLDAAEKAGISLSETEIKIIEKEAKLLGNDDYFLKNYNVTSKKYIEMKNKIKTCDKFYDNIIISEDKKAEIIKENYRDFFTADIKVIFFDTTNSDDGVSGLNRLEAEKVFDALKNDETLFEALYEEYNDPGFSDGLFETVADRKIYDTFPDVFEAVYEGNVNEILKIESEKGIVVLKILNKNDKGNISNLQEIIVKNMIADIIEKAPKAVKTDVYEKIDVKKYIDERSKIN